MLKAKVEFPSFSWTELLLSTGFGVLGCFSLFVAYPGMACAQETRVDFGRDIGPILSDTCFKCHGPDEHERKADLRLDTKSGLFDDSSAVVANDLDASELYQRITSDDPDTLMPPSDSGRTLTDQQKELFRNWIEQGAIWKDHWSLIPPAKPEIPDENLAWAKNPIDNFIANRLAVEGLAPSEVADRRTLIRRVALDLTGLPPTPEQKVRYVDSKDPNWYEVLVDELLESPHYGEHMARYWLDAARYGDTHGLHLDNYREMWPYRDWVVRAFNDNVSYRDFTIQQLAGDLLENPTDQQLIASGFNRAHITTNEGGAIVEEVFVRNVVDRVSTTGTVFLGMTVGCAQCHDHKFDPISQKEFYQLFAFFNNLTDAAMDQNIENPAPVMKVVSEKQKTELTELETQAREAAKKLEDQVAGYQYVDPVEAPGSETDAEFDVLAEIAEPVEFVWIEDDVLPVGAKPEQNWEYVTADNGPVHSGVNSRIAVSESGMIQHFFTGATTPIKVDAGDQLFAYVFLDPANAPEQIMLQFNDGNWEHRVYWGANKIEWGTDKTASRFFAGELPETGQWIRLEIEAEKIGFETSSLINGIAFTQWGGTAHWDSAGIVSRTDQSSDFKSLSKWLAMVRQSKGEGLPDQIKEIVSLNAEKVGDSDKQKLREFFLLNVYSESRVELADELRQRDESKKKLDEFNNNLPTTLVSRESPEIKQAFVLIRGEYDHPGERVERDTPAALPRFTDDLPRNRLGFARWLTSDKHPLAARVAVNRFWQQVFGTGIVKTSEDFGAQGDVPSHPELLDWLATDFAEHGWDVRRLMKMLVLSSTYRQSSTVSPELEAKDPANRLLGRGPRFRLDAEMLRDQALSVSGLLDPTLGGPSVKPPQPDGLWFAVGYSGSNTVRFKKDNGTDKVHRRSLYTFWKRTAPPPQMNTFDAPSREECRVRRERTNTPMQALLMMNDPQYIEAARYLAELTIDQGVNQVVSSGFDSEGSRRSAAFMFERALGRLAKNQELDLLQKTWEKNYDEFETDLQAARKLVSIGETAADIDKYDPVELAAWTMIANLIMNMDEFVTKN